MTETNEKTELRTAEGDTIEFAREYQGVTIWLGDGIPVHINDETFDEDVLDLIQSAGQRVVTIARLRRIADILDCP